MSKTVKTGVDASQQSGFVKGGPTGSFKLPTGTTAERDANTTAGQIRFNSQTNFLEFFNGSAFVQLQGATNAKHTITVDSYTGDGTTTVFGNGASSDASSVEKPLSFAPSADQNVLIFIDGVFQPDSVYAISGQQVTFGAAPGSGTSIKVLHGFDSV